MLIGTDDPLRNSLKEAVTEKETNDSKGDNNNRKKYSRSGLSEDQAKKYLDRILEYMEEKKPYLDRNLTIYDLSQQTGIARHHITQVLNDLHGRNFFTFINEYRVKEVVSRMKDPAFKNYTLLAIAYDSGFNSKSTFNTIFKNITRLTPTQYLEKLGDVGP